MSLSQKLCCKMSYVAHTLSCRMSLCQKPCCKMSLYKMSTAKMSFCRMLWRQKLCCNMSLYKVSAAKMSSSSPYVVVQDVMMHRSRVAKCHCIRCLQPIHHHAGCHDARSRNARYFCSFLTPLMFIITQLLFWRCNMGTGRHYSHFAWF